MSILVIQLCQCTLQYFYLVMPLNECSSVVFYLVIELPRDEARRFIAEGLWEWSFGRGTLVPLQYGDLGVSHSFFLKLDV